MRHSRLALIAAAALVLTGCNRDLSSNTYTTGSTGGKVLEGVIVSSHAVVIKDHDKLQDNTTGGLIGGAGGAVAGSSIGNGTGSIGAGIGGAVLGAIGGALIEDALSTSDGFEYLVKLDAKYLRKDGNRTHKKLKESGNNLVEDDMKASIDTDFQTDTISVVQATDKPLAVGTHVYVVYNNDRPRVEPVPASVK